ncbi:hypothetical protein JCM8547_008918 [Rhodosporidiobolus lusitaniae]
MASDTPADPPTFLSCLPGDATLSPSPSPSPSPPPAASSSPAPPALTPNPGPDGQAQTHLLTSVSPSDPSRTRTFESRYFLPPSSSTASAFASSSRSFLDLPESYFTPTPSELQQAYAGQVKKREELTDRPLLTKRLREREEAEKNREKARRWPNTRIRIRFADRSQLEGVFPSTDKLVHLYEFVRLALREDVRENGWFLYQSPPRTEYRKGDPQWRGKTLMDLELTPSSALYIKFEEDEEFNDPSRPPPLISDLLTRAAPLPLPPSFTSDPSASPDCSSGAPKSADDLKKEKEDKLRKLLGGGKGILGGGNKGSVKPGWMKGGKDAHKK